jgi:signal transduction histidine kinase
MNSRTAAGPQQDRCSAAHQVLGVWLTSVCVLHLQNAVKFTQTGFIRIVIKRASASAGSDEPEAATDNAGPGEGKDEDEGEGEGKREGGGKGGLALALADTQQSVTLPSPSSASAAVAAAAHGATRTQVLPETPDTCGDTLEVSVVDTGRGIRPEDVPKLFKK